MLDAHSFNILYFPAPLAQNGGFWGTASGWVLPVIAMNNSAVAEQLVRDAIADARAHGLNEWHNSQYSSNAAGRPNTSAVPGKCSASGLGCQNYPLHANFLGGAMTYGPNIGSVYQAAKILLGAHPPTPPPPPPGPPPADCNLTALWRFFSARANASETNPFLESEDGALSLKPGRNDAWKSANGRFMSDWSAVFHYGTPPTVTTVHCVVDINCSFVKCPDYTYTRIK